MCLESANPNSSSKEYVFKTIFRGNFVLYHNPFQFLVYFFTECDAAFFKSLSLNCIRVATYRHYFEDNLNPRVLKPDCFKYLDRVVMVYAKYGIYTIIDMHTAPGGQNGGWHSDHGAHLAAFWTRKDFQDRLVWL